MNILVVYFSWSGNTKEIAKAIQNSVNGHLFEIEPVIPYPQDYNEMVMQAKEEINNKYFPKLKTSLHNIDNYDIIFIGTPNWWGSLPPAVCSFLKIHNLSGKNIIPFITHGGGGEQNVLRKIKELCANSKIENNAWVSYGNCISGLYGWLNELGLLYKI